MFQFQAMYLKMVFHYENPINILLKNEGTIHKEVGSIDRAVRKIRCKRIEQSPNVLVDNG